MRRALVLITVLTLFTFGCGLWLDHLQRDTAEDYLQGVQEIRRMVLDGRMQEAKREQAYLHALWQRDAAWLNCLINHHHTRDVDAALLHLATGLEMKSELLCMAALDEAQDALEEVARSELPRWQNIL